MNQANVRDILAMVDSFAPFDAALSYDNVGILVGHPDAPVDTVLVALDLTMGAVEEAAKLGAQLILTHHPVMFGGRKHMREDDAEGAVIAALIRHRMAMIAAHTNFDAAPGGVSEILASAVSIKQIVPACDGLFAVGGYDGTLRDLERVVRERINPHARVYGSDQRIERVAVCGGAGGSFWADAHAAGANCYLTGEIKHHEALEAVQMGLRVIDAGHYETEHLSLNQLACGLQTRANALQYQLQVIVSEFHPFI